MSRRSQWPPADAVRRHTGRNQLASADAVEDELHSESCEQDAGDARDDVLPGDAEESVQPRRHEQQPELQGHDQQQRADHCQLGDQAVACHIACVVNACNREAAESASGETPIMGETGHEAILPLRRTRSGDLGVVAGGGAPVVNFTINNAHPTARVTSEQSTDGRGNLTIDVMIDASKRRCRRAWPDLGQR